MTRRNIKETTSIDFSIQYVHDGTAKIKCWTYSITRLIESKRVEHCLVSRLQKLRRLLGGSLRLISSFSSGCPQGLEGRRLPVDAAQRFELGFLVN